MAPFAPGTLWQRVLRATERGERTGALQPIPTRSETVEDGGTPFQVRVVDNLRRKQAARHAQQRAADAGRPANPFLPHDDDLFVAQINETHLCLLNKFNVLDHHLLIVTRDFAEQESVLDRADFDALWTCLREVDGLGFYNGGVMAGASQRHKHLQLAPYPLAPGRSGPPIEAVFDRAVFDGGIGRIPDLPFEHALTLHPDSGRTGAESVDRYLGLLHAIGLPPTPDDLQSGPYNLLVTRDWTLAVPRTREFFESVSVNAIGFAGGLLVRDDAEFARVKEVGPMAVLAATAGTDDQFAACLARSRE